MRDGNYTQEKQFPIKTKRTFSRGYSSTGRAPALHAGGQEFDSPSLHQISRTEKRSFSLKFKQTAMLCAGTHRMELEVKKIIELSKYNDLLTSVINHSLM